MEARQVNPIQDLFKDIEKIIEFMEVKDLREAMEYETSEIRDEAEVWMAAMMERDNYLTYRHLWNASMFQETLPNVKFNDVRVWMENPYSVPLVFRDNLLTRGRQLYLNSYVEKNQYYRMLSGLPPIDTPSSEYVYLSEPLKNQLHTDDIPVHELSTLVQNRYISTEEYQDIIKDNPDKRYLKYLGIYKIDLLTSRKAKDFELIRYLPMGRSDINPNLLKEFGSLYSDYREYVMVVLYNKHLEGVYESYRSYMGMLITSFTLMQICNKSIEHVSDRRFLDDAILHIILSMHGIPRSLLMTKEVRRNLVVNLLKLTRQKSTDEVYYNLVQILGYHDIIISKLMLMRGQEFDENGDTSLDSFDDIDQTTTLDPITNKPIHPLDVDPYFIGINLKDPNPYDTIINGKAPIYSYRSITEDDPMWWDEYCECGAEGKCKCEPDCPNCTCFIRDVNDTQALLRDKHYTVADSKYIMIEAIIHQIQYLFESIYFTRLILDNKEYTDTFEISIPEIFGTESVSIYDIMVFIIAATCMINNLSGKISNPEQEMIATAGFNFDIDLDLFQKFLSTTKYVDRDRIMLFLENISMRTPSDINRLFNEVMYPMREWLETKISQSTNKYEFLEYESIYRSLYTYDVTNNTFLEDFRLPIDIIKDKYELTDDEMLAFKVFYPRMYTGEPITADNFPESKYNPFLINNPVTWNINIEYKEGVLYFHDILNSPDLRFLYDANGVMKDEDGNPIRNMMFWDEYYNDYDGTYYYEIDRDAVKYAIYTINGLSDNELKDAVFRVDTPILNSGGRMFYMGEKIPSNIRTEIFKQILVDKIIMDMEGLAVPPATYKEYLYRKNPMLYQLLTDNNRFEYERDLWMEDVMTIVLALETELNMHMKYFEQSIVGSELFFRPLITLINHFKSTFVNFAKTGLRYVLGDKIDSGGNSNMLKLFDSMSTTIHFVLLSKKGQYAQFGLYDTEHKAKYHIVMKDRSELIRQRSDRIEINNRKNWMGSIRMVDEMKFFKNGQDMDPSSWYVGEHSTGRWSKDEDFIMQVRSGNKRVQNLPVDTEEWKNHVEV